MNPNQPVKRAVGILGVSLGLGLIFDLLFYEKIPGVSFPLYVMLVLAVILLAMHRFKARIPKYAPLVALPLLFFSWMVFVRSAELLTFLNTLLSLYLLGLLAGLTFKPKLRRYAFLDYLKPLYELPIEIIRRAGTTLAEITKQRNSLGKHTLSPQVIRGVLITIPIALLFVILFASADLVFRKYVTELFDFRINDQLLPHLFVIALVSLFFVGVLGYLARKVIHQTPSEGEAHTDNRSESQRWGMVETTILFGSLNALFLSFIVLQLAYMFGGEQNIAGQGFTYAEYARKGFFELIAVAVLSFALITGAEKVLLSRNQTHNSRFKILSGVLVVQVLIVMASAFSRLLLYEDAYGFTVSRFYAHSFLIWLAVIFCILLYKIFWNRRESVFAFLSFTSVILLFAGINLANVDAFVARQNIERYHATGKLDGEYLIGLSDDAIPEITKLLDGKDKGLRDNLAGELYLRYQDDRARESHWQSTNLSRDAALKALEERKSLLETNKNKRIKAGYNIAFEHAQKDCEKSKRLNLFHRNLDCNTVRLEYTLPEVWPRTFYFGVDDLPRTYSITIDRNGTIIDEESF